MPEGWKYVGFPEEFLEEIDKLIKNAYVKKNYGYTSVPDFLRDGGRNLIQKIKKEIEEYSGVKL